MKKLPKLDQPDWGYAPLDPDPDFDAKHNQRVIDEVMRKNELLFKKKKRAQTQGIKERSSAIASYVLSIEKDKSNTSPESYFGKKHLGYLRGREIIDIMKNAKKNQQSQAQGR